MQLTLRRFSEPVRVHGLELVDRVYPLPLQASFQCDQPFLNRLWEKSCATVAACSTDLFIDCPWREQTFWLDDYYEENLYYLCLTAERTFLERNLRVSAEAAFPDGQMPGRYPSARDERLPVTTANWIMVLADYYRYTGDLALVRELLPVADAALGWFDSLRDADLLVPDQTDQWNFIDWGYDTAGIQLGGKTAVLNMLVAAVCREAARLHEAAGDPARAQHLEARSRETVAALLKALWRLRGSAASSTAPSPGTAGAPSVRSPTPSASTTICWRVSTGRGRCRPSSIRRWFAPSWATSTSCSPPWRAPGKAGGPWPCCARCGAGWSPPTRRPCGRSSTAAPP